MGRFFSQQTGCAHARAWASLEVDGELSHLERVMLAAHLRRCADCTEIVEDVRATTALIRSTPLEQPQRRVELPDRHRRGVTFRIALAATLAALAAGLGVIAGVLESSSSKPAPTGPDVALVTPGARSPSEELRRQDIEGPKEPVFPPGRRGGNV